jgi:hypothetical protein
MPTDVATIDALAGHQAARAQKKGQFAQLQERSWAFADAPLKGQENPQSRQGPAALIFAVISSYCDRT